MTKFMEHKKNGKVDGIILLSIIVPVLNEEETIGFFLHGVVRPNPRNFRHPKSSPVMIASRSIIFPSLWKI